MHTRTQASGSGIKRRKPKKSSIICDRGSGTKDQAGDSSEPEPGSEHSAVVKKEQNNELLVLDTTASALTAEDADVKTGTEETEKDPVPGSSEFNDEAEVSVGSVWKFAESPIDGLSAEEFCQDDLNVGEDSGKGGILFEDCDANSLKNVDDDLGMETDKQKKAKMERRFRCRECHKTFVNAGSLHRHQKVHGQDAAFMCRYCNKGFSYLVHLTAHEAAHEQGKSYKCRFCGKEFSKPSRVEDHERVHTGERPHQCQDCGKTFRLVAQYNEHMRRHVGDKRHECPECRKTFVTNGDMKIHYRSVHKDERPYLCTECGKTFKLAGRLNRHVLVIHKGQKVKLSRSESDLPVSDSGPAVKKEKCRCDTCGSNFATLSSLKRHERVVHGSERRFKCEYCEKTFTASHHMKLHVARKHTGERRHKCPHCEECFFTLSARANHLLSSHSSEDTEVKCYTCERCSKKFTSIHSLHRHVMSHTGERPFKCQFCPKAFVQKSTMKTHEYTIHSGQRPVYICTVCSKSFTQQSSLKVHQRKYHGNREKLELKDEPVIVPVSSVSVTVKY